MAANILIAVGCVLVLVGVVGLFLGVVRLFRRRPRAGDKGAADE